MSALGIGAATMFGAHCAPSDDMSVRIVDKCDGNALNLSDPAEHTVKLYLDEATELRDRAKELLTRFTTICNAINKDLGEPEGSEVHQACNNIATHIQAANARAPIPTNGTAPPLWVAIKFDATCSLDGASAAKCIDLCATQKGCDPNKCPTTLIGKCNGECRSCLGVPSTDPTTCFGQCRGSCASPDPATVDGGLPGCQGECIGKCKSPTWQGSCSTGCSAAFRGFCAGKCSGTCDNVAFDGGTPGTDAGPDGEAPTPGVPGSGNCAGICTGKCEGQASGSCGVLPGSPAPCLGDFFGGLCPGVGNCVGTCSGAGVACATTCKGTCVSASNACPGACLNCQGTIESGSCPAVPTCEANAICKDVCGLRGALDAKCTPTAADIIVAGDYKLPDALRAHIAEFTKAARDANVLSTNIGGVLGRTEGQFLAIGVVNEGALACAKAATPIYEEARKDLNQAIGASLVLTGAKF
jgi:hypothetical protein